ncbi:increased DNA methylation 3-like isoform X2 [Chenopodium quinoa]|uniref:increased DNA methylation 3-like isoform X2 n=1 Tax=Chenopodium quinoa TaxID=63459 RepID=UPI000B792899|nr:increased DNA methylation 3-like isoform X2 [Chenopodium quinoa]
MGENPTLQFTADTTQVVLTGTARDGTAGPPIGHVDIGISESAYLFRVALPGIRKDNCDLSCEIERDGKVHLQGNITGGELAKKNPKTVYHLSLSQSDGILEGVVMKYKAPGVPPCGNQFDPAIPA